MSITDHLHRQIESLRPDIEAQITAGSGVQVILTVHEGGRLRPPKVTVHYSGDISGDDRPVSTPSDIDTRL